MPSSPLYGAIITFTHKHLNWGSQAEEEEEEEEGKTRQQCQTPLLSYCIVRLCLKGGLEKRGLCMEIIEL